MVNVHSVQVVVVVNVHSVQVVVAVVYIGDLVLRVSSKIYLLCYAALLQNAPIMLNKCPYYAQIMLIKLSRVRYYRHLTLNFN